MLCFMYFIVISVVSALYVSNPPPLPQFCHKRMAFSEIFHSIEPIYRIINWHFGISFGITIREKWFRFAVLCGLLLHLMSGNMITRIFDDVQHNRDVKAQNWMLYKFKLIETANWWLNEVSIKCVVYTQHNWMV